MKDLLKVCRMFIIVLLIVLACTGVGISGGIPIPNINKREDSISVQKELPEQESSDGVKDETKNS